MKKAHLTLILLTVILCCFGLWTLLSLYSALSTQSAQALPGFTRLLVDWRSLIFVLPAPLAAYLMLAIWRPAFSPDTAKTFSLCSISALAIASFPIFWAVILPCVKLMELQYAQ